MGRDRTCEWRLRQRRETMACGGDEPELQGIQRRAGHGAGQDAGHGSQIGGILSRRRAFCGKREGRLTLPKIEKSFRKCGDFAVLAAFFARFVAHLPSLSVCRAIRQDDAAAQRKLARCSIFTPS
ncbi:MAG TPA: hypothetical protein VFS04_11055 [Alphaproteobacteria bacterium]|nr:hypothetical protein [Alphaproteobacteria bacterium]